MATRAKTSSQLSTFERPPRRGKGEPVSEEGPGIMVCIHVLRPMTQPKKRAQRQEGDREE